MFLGDPFGLIIRFGISILATDGFLPGLFGGLIATGAGLIAAISGVKNVNEWWKILSTDSVPIDAALTTDGLVQIQGYVQPPPSGDTLISPIQNERCVAYKYALKYQVEVSNDGYIDSGTEYNSFIISDETGKIFVDPTEDSLSLTTDTHTVAGQEEMLEQVDSETVDLDSSAHTEDSGIIKSPIELTEGTISVDEQITVIGRANAVPKGGTADAAMTSGEEHLIVMNDEPGNTALRTGALGILWLILGSGLCIFGITGLTSTLSGLM